MRKLTVCLLLSFYSIFSSAQSVQIIPQPVSVKQPKIAARFTITPATVLVLEGSNLDNSARFINDYLEQNYLFRLNIVQNSSSKNAIRLNYERMDNELPGAYTLTTDAKGIYIAGDNEEGVFYGIQT